MQSEKFVKQKTRDRATRETSQSNRENDKGTNRDAAFLQHMPGFQPDKLLTRTGDLCSYYVRSSGVATLEGYTTSCGRQHVAQPEEERLKTSPFGERSGGDDVRRGRVARHATLVPRELAPTTGRGNEIFGQGWRSPR
ncbi:hypothetical protein CISG_07674 [Coccidioides immitis RMSCC 3703]|uniref:Uncharacterized protein n=1 Tax=Coccidioides immitis RMSCC 3703 TaxID=454286 RepID=A0A0J8R695_COCIT|nr:hypothetical protein CISG_07674 [Coccidioides immitis RMSCC 3703]